MRFIAKFRKYSHGIQSEEEMVLANGKTQTIVPRIVARFEHGDVLDHERAVARGTLDFKGTQMELDEVTPVDPANRLSAYDTESEWNLQEYARLDRLQGWEEGTTKALVEQILQRDTLFGDYMFIPLPEIAAPWPNYDEIQNVKTITSRVHALGFDPDDVITYEARHQNRQEVIDALRALADAPAATEDGSPLVEA